MSAITLNTVQQFLAEQLKLIKEMPGCPFPTIDVHQITFQNLRANTGENSIDALVSKSSEEKGMWFTIGLPVAFASTAISSGKFAANYASYAPALALHVNPQTLFDANLTTSLKIEPLAVLDFLLPALISRARSDKGPQRFDLAAAPLGQIADTAFGFVIPINLSFPTLFKRSS